MDLRWVCFLGYRIRRLVLSPTRLLFEKFKGGSESRIYGLHGLHASCRVLRVQILDSAFKVYQFEV